MRGVRSIAAFVMIPHASPNHPNELPAKLFDDFLRLLKVEANYDAIKPLTNIQGTLKACDIIDSQVRDAAGPHAGDAILQGSPSNVGVSDVAAHEAPARRSTKSRTACVAVGGLIKVVCL